MDIAYVISAYRLPHQLVRLVSRLQDEGVTFLVHVDAKSGHEVMGPILEKLGGRPDVHLLDRHPCHWGDFGHVEASLKGIRRIVERRIPCDRVVLLTGQDYPVTDRAAIREFFEAHPDSEYLEHFPLPREGWFQGGMPRLEHWHFWWGGRHIELPVNSRRIPAKPQFIGRILPKRRPLPSGLRPYGGGGYWSLSREAVEYIHAFLGQDPAYCRYFRRVYIPDEIFFQTLLLNSPLRDRVVNDDLRYTVWRDDARSPAVLGVGDVADIRASQALFARKFDTGVDARVLDLLDEACL